MTTAEVRIEPTCTCVDLHTRVVAEEHWGRGWRSDGDAGADTRANQNFCQRPATLPPPPKINPKINSIKRRRHPRT